MLIVTLGLPGSDRVLATLWWVGPGARSGGCGARSGRLPRSAWRSFSSSAVEVVFDAADQLSQPRDFGVRGHRLGAGPVVEFGCGPDPFAVTQQRVEVVPQLRQVGGVGAEVPAAQAPEPERAGPAAGLNVGRLGADAERDRDLTDRQALVFAFQQHPRLAPHVFPASVELHGRKGIHGSAHPGRGDRVVALSGGCRAMPHQLSQHVDRCAGVRVPLGVAVPVGVEEHRGLVELGAVRAPQRLQFVNPAAMRRGEGVIGDRLGSLRVAVCPRQQRKVGQRGVREAFPHIAVCVR